jgi:hypothetical protein
VGRAYGFLIQAVTSSLPVWPIVSRSVRAAATVGKDGRGFDVGNYAEQRICRVLV